jgi:uncharacterized protein (DUF1778 family)
MPATRATREDRIELRATKEEKRILAAARAAVDRAERIVLSGRDSARVMALLENPPKPTPALLAAARRRRTARK